MTLLELYIFVGLPLIGLAMAGGALWLTSWSANKVDREQLKSGE